QHARNQSGRRIDQNKRRQFPSGQDIVAHRDFLRLQREPHPFIDSFVMSTEDHEPSSLGREILRVLLGKGPTLWRWKEQAGFLSPANASPALIVPTARKIGSASIPIPAPPP